MICSAALREISIYFQDLKLTEYFKMSSRDKIFLQDFLRNYVKKLEENNITTDELNQLKLFFLKTRKPCEEPELVDMLFLGFFLKNRLYNK